MDYNTVSQAIGSLGFPIVCACGFFWMLNTTMKEFTETMKEFTENVQKMDKTLTALLEHERERDANATC